MITGKKDQQQENSSIGLFKCDIYLYILNYSPIVLYYS